MREGIGSLSGISERGRNEKRAEETLVTTGLPVIYPWHLPIHLLKESDLKGTELKEIREVVSPCCHIKQPGGHCPFPSSLQS